MELSKAMRTEAPGGETKLVDLMSRINGGVLVIPGLDDVGDTERGTAAYRNRRVDKVCISVSLLLRRFECVEEVPWALLKFISRTKFRYGVRSIHNLIDLIPLEIKNLRKLQIQDLKKLPLGDTADLKGSHLAHHIICDDGPTEVVNLWRKVRRVNKLVRIKEEPKKPMSPVDALVRFLWEEK